MMKAGNYYIGDLCYVMNDDEWREVCSLTLTGYKSKEGVFTLSDGRMFACFNTKYGDGTYPTNVARWSDSEQTIVFDVDSGTIGCMLVDDISELTTRTAFMIHEDFTPESDGSILKFGPVKVYTGDDADDDSLEACYDCLSS